MCADQLLRFELMLSPHYWSFKLLSILKLQLHKAQVLCRLLQDAQPGDSIFLYYSGEQRKFESDAPTQHDVTWNDACCTTHHVTAGYGLLLPHGLGAQDRFISIPFFSFGDWIWTNLDEFGWVWWIRNSWIHFDVPCSNLSLLFVMLIQLELDIVPLLVSSLWRQNASNSKQKLDESVRMPGVGTFESCLVPIDYGAGVPSGFLPGKRVVSQQIVRWRQC